MTEEPTYLNQISVFDADLLDIACMCHAANAQDSPYPKEFYLDQILNRTFAYLSSAQRKEIDEYLAEKKYLPLTEIIIETH